MVEVDRDQRLVVVVQDTFQFLALGSVLQDLVDFLDRGVGIIDWVAERARRRSE